MLETKVYTSEQLEAVYERDIQPLFDERKEFLQEFIIHQAEVRRDLPSEFSHWNIAFPLQNTYERLTNTMYTIVDRLLAFIEPPAEHWDEHQGRLEHVTAQLIDLMRECRRPHDLQNEVNTSISEEFAYPVFH